MEIVRAKLNALSEQSVAVGRVAAADEFAYDDQVDRSRSEGQGLRVLFVSGTRVVFRLSGIGAEGATIRVYLEAFEADPTKMGGDPAEALAAVIESAEANSNLRAITGRTVPAVGT